MKLTCLLLSFFIAFHCYGQKKTNPPDSNLVLIKGGRFKPGDRKGEPDEHPSKRIKLNSFYLGKFEVSNAEFVEFLNAKGNQNNGHSYWLDLNGNWKDLKCRIYSKNDKFYIESGYENYPVNYVSWFASDEYCKWKGGRLPTEVEWEYAVKKGMNGNKLTLEETAWYEPNSESKWHKRGEKMPDSEGVYDLRGNLWEWCDDFYKPDYYKTRRKNEPKGPETGDFRVIRGGSWTNGKEMLRVSNRNAINPNSNKINVGFRIAYDLEK